MVLFETAELFHFNIIVNNKMYFITTIMKIFHKLYLCYFYI